MQRVLTQPSSELAGALDWANAAVANPAQKKQLAQNMEATVLFMTSKLI
jgi:hypothetical protein